jgi:hypothetical protein
VALESLDKQHRATGSKAYGTRRAGKDGGVQEVTGLGKSSSWQGRVILMGL